ncbi:beta-ketoacyl synthase N-terminal-like domain-containing protein [Pseudotenacibaculum sp. MALMAid0570]|uniref:beta-ketoacyl synthase N-terminal-like domain-containing protein n=1 Tax=Pseudotenacibaculum sp. MALMAid0570 TaxID=3143938 RepID=UPI0032E022AD
MKEPISIVSISTLSALGSTQEEIWSKYLNSDHFITEKQFNFDKALVAELPKEAKKEIKKLRESDAKYKKLDDTVLYAIYVSRKATKKAGWKSKDHFGINIGSSRGATHLFEKYHQTFLKNQKTPTLTSPTTTLGNVASWVAHDLQSQGPEISHSITCSTALHALLNGVAWIQAGLTEKFLVGGTEASLTEFTIAQMKAMKIYANKNVDYPCRAFDLEKKKNTMVLGEGASSICLEKGNLKEAIAKIEGIGYATEILEHNISISTEAECFQKSMQMAIKDINPDEIDAIVMHAPGTIQGDLSEYKAIEKIFNNNKPFLTTNKWKLGHTFGASGMLSLELAILMLEKQQIIAVPFTMKQDPPKKIEKILVNAVGFGGNAVSVLLTN